ncbi:MAG: DUF4160 domain-containing protein [Chloroflexota bacterium]
MPTWLIERGYRFGIVAADCSEPPHVHVIGYGGAAKFWLRPLREAQSAGYNGHRLREARRIVAEHQVDFERKWHAFCG